MAARDWIKSRITSKTPTSLIRLGDGEFSWLGYGGPAPLQQTALALNVWFGRDDFDPVLLAATADRLRLAVRRATVIGLPRPSRQLSDPFCGYVNELFAQYELASAGQIFTDCGVHRFWQMMLAYRDLLTGLPFLGLVSGRDVSEHVRSTFSIDKIDVYQVPAERAMLGPFEGSGPHYPERFDQLCGELIVPFRGAVFLIGAGALGKIYADVISERGGIALDVGSVLDGWAGQASRGFLRQDPTSFGLDCYRQTVGLGAEEALDRYRNLLKSSFYGHTPSQEEFGFYEEMRGLSKSNLPT
jgi:hypothetical protein